MDLNEHIVLVTVRTSSSRLPNKCLLSFGDDTVIVHVVKRAISYGLRPIICTSIDSTDDVLENIAKELDIECFRGSLNNKLNRWLECTKKFNITSFHSIDADDPFFDGSEMIESLNLLKSSNHDVVCPTKSSSAGAASVGYSLTREIIRKALKNLEDDDKTGVGTLAAAYANRGIVKDRKEQYEEALKDYTIDNCFQFGDSVKIENGPFKNKTGKVERVYENQIILLLNTIKIKLSLSSSKVSLVG